MSPTLRSLIAQCEPQVGLSSPDASPAFNPVLAYPPQIVVSQVKNYQRPIIFCLKDMDTRCLNVSKQGKG